MAGREQAEPVVEACDQSVYAQSTYASSSQLQSERDPIKPSAQHRNSWSAVIVQGEAPVGSYRSGDEQLHGTRTVKLIRTVRRCGHLQRRHTPHGFPGKA
jgi:hypothetical protein